MCEYHGDRSIEQYGETFGKNWCVFCEMEGRKKRLNGGFNPNKKGILYYIYSQGVYKIGVTNRTVIQRFSHIKEPILVLKIWEYEIGYDAWREQQRILKEFKWAKHNGENVNGLGTTELFDRDVLNLDEK